MNQDPTYVNKVIQLLLKKYHDKLQTELVHKNVNELFVATLLSPQCTDKQVNVVTKDLFKRFRSFGDYADADIRTLTRCLNRLNYYKTKARRLKQAAQFIISEFNGKVPKKLEEIIKIPGVGRKVGNVILVEGYGITDGIPIDTHCIVVSNRLGFVDTEKPDKIEQVLMDAIPKKDWIIISDLLIALGRDTCKARKTECERCVLNALCPSSTIREDDKITSSVGFKSIKQ